MSFNNCFDYNLNKNKKFIKEYDEIINNNSCIIIINDQIYNINMLKEEFDISEEYLIEDYKDQNEMDYDNWIDEYDSS